MDRTSNQQMPRIVVLISGSGTNLQAFINAINSKQLTAKIVCVISNRPGVMGLDRARMADIPTQVINHQDYESREAFDTELAETIDSYNPDLVILAGFMRILTPAFVAKFLGKLMNIHPSLLPKYPGLHTHQRALDAGDSEAGSSVHFVTQELDGGPIIIQAPVKIKPGDSADTLADRVLLVEHKIYPLAADWFCQGKLVLSENSVLLDGKPLPQSGYLFNEHSLS